jgi:hypothetical protein
MEYYKKIKPSNINRLKINKDKDIDKIIQKIIKKLT